MALRQILRVEDRLLYHMKRDCGPDPMVALEKIAAAVQEQFVRDENGRLKFHRDDMRAHVILFYGPPL